MVFDAKPNTKEWLMTPAWQGCIHNSDTGSSTVFKLGKHECARTIVVVLDNTAVKVKNHMDEADTHKKTSFTYLKTAAMLTLHLLILFIVTVLTLTAEIASSQPNFTFKQQSKHQT